MENPATWGRAEHVINEALKEYDWEINTAGGGLIIGLSLPRRIADALREADLLYTDEARKETYDTGFADESASAWEQI
jgi:hypothetical protein